MAPRMEITDREETIVLSKEKKVTGTLLWIVIVACLGSMQYGYHLWIIYSPAVIIHHFHYLDDEALEIGNVDSPGFLLMIALTMSVFPVGGTTGSLVFGPLVDKYGRKGALFLNSFFAVISCLIMVCANMLHSFGLVMFARFVIGISIGIYSSATPLYIAEISPVKSRGAMSMLPYFFIALGLVVAQILSFHELLGTHGGWPVLMSLSGILALFQCFLMTSFPESPRYLLIQRRDEEQARRVLRHLRGVSDVENEIEELHQEDILEAEEKDMNALKLLTYRDLRWQVLSIIVLMVAQQFSGVNSAYYYASKIYASMGISLNYIPYINLSSSTVIMGTILFTMLFIDSKGRRVLLLIGFGAISIISLLLTISIEIQKKNGNTWMLYTNIALVNLFINAQVIGPGSLRYLLMAELFRQSSRSSAYVVGGFTHWIIHFFGILIYVQIKQYIGPYTFLVSLPFCVAAFLYIYKVIPETKNRTFMEIYNLLSEEKKAAFDVEPDE